MRCHDPRQHVNRKTAKSEVQCQPEIKYYQRRLDVVYGTVREQDKAKNMTARRLAGLTESLN